MRIDFDANEAIRFQEDVHKNSNKNGQYHNWHDNRVITRFILEKDDIEWRQDKCYGDEQKQCSIQYIENRKSRTDYLKHLFLLIINKKRHIDDVAQYKLVQFKLFCLIIHCTIDWQCGSILLRGRRIRFSRNFLLHWLFHRR